MRVIGAKCLSSNEMAFHLLVSDSEKTSLVYMDLSKGTAEILLTKPHAEYGEVLAAFEAAEEKGGDESG